MVSYCAASEMLKGTSELGERRSLEHRRIERAVSLPQALFDEEEVILRALRSDPNQRLAVSVSELTFQIAGVVRTWRAVELEIRVANLARFLSHLVAEPVLLDRIGRLRDRFLIRRLDVLLQVSIHLLGRPTPLNVAHGLLERTRRPIAGAAFVGINARSQQQPKGHQERPV